MSNEAFFVQFIPRLAGSLLLVYLLTRFFKKKFEKTKGEKNAIVYSSLTSAVIVGIITYFTMGFKESIFWYFPSILFWFIYDVVRLAKKGSKIIPNSKNVGEPLKRTINKYWILAGGILMGIVIMFGFFIILGAIEEKKDTKVKEVQTKSIENFCQDAYSIKNKIAEIDPTRLNNNLTEKGEGLFLGSDAFVRIPETKESVERSIENCRNMFETGTDAFGTKNKIDSLSSAVSRFDGNEKMIASQIVSEIRNMHAGLKDLCDLTGDVYDKAGEVKIKNDLCSKNWSSTCSDSQSKERQELQSFKDELRKNEESFQNTSNQIGDLLTQMSGMPFNQTWNKY